MEIASMDSFLFLCFLSVHAFKDWIPLTYTRGLTLCPAAYLQYGTEPFLALALRSVECAEFVPFCFFKGTYDFLLILSHLRAEALLACPIGNLPPPTPCCCVAPCVFSTRLF